MAEYLSPGVYVEEYDSSARSIEGVGTSTAGFVGMAAKGAVIGAPELVTSFAQFTRIYGGFLSEQTHGDFRYLAYAVEQFFINGGTRCYVMRVAPDSAKKAAVQLGLLTASAKNPGKWGDKIVISVTGTNRYKLQLTEKLDECIYKAKSTAGFTEGDFVKFGEEYNVIKSITDNEIVFDAEFTADPVDTALLPKKVIYSTEADIIIRADDEIEKYEGVTLNYMSANFAGAKLEKSAIVDVTIKLPTEAGAFVELFTGTEDKNNAAISLAGGADGDIKKVDAGTFIGIDNGPGKRTGIQSFLENDTVSIMSVPGVTIPEVLISLIAHCENLKSRFALLDIPRNLVKTSDIQEYRSIYDSSYAAMYHPWIQVYDRVTRSNTFVPPSGTVSGVYSRTDVSRGVHKAPANEAVMCSGLSTYFNKGEQDILNPIGVNLIRSFPGQGIKVWGARTLSSNSNFKYVNVRRLFIYVEESIKSATNWVVFEPNDPSLWTRVSFTISSFLNTLWRAGMLTGSTESEAYFVDIGATTMTRDDIMNGRLICNIGIAPSRPAEFVIFRITQHTSEASASAE